MEEKIYITGHRNPDTDSICSALAYADLKRQLGYNAVAVRIGDINRETQFVLDYFNVNAPKYITTLKTKLSDLNLDTAPMISPDLSIRSAWEIMKEHTLKFLPVVENNKIIGVLTLTDIANKYIDPLENKMLNSSNTPLETIVKTLDGELIYGDKESFKTTGRIFVASMSSVNIDKFVEKGDIVIIGDNVKAQKAIITRGITCLILTDNIEIDQELIKLVKESNKILIRTPHDAYTTSRLINQSIPVSQIMTKGSLIMFNINELVENVKEKMVKIRKKYYPVVNNKDEVRGILSRYNVISYEKKKLILVDHNSKSQTIDGIEDAEIIEIIDHHRVGELKTPNPILFRNEPVGSTSTIIGSMYLENGLVPSPEIAGILCSGIVSDTIIFRSPTCTVKDINMAKKLSKIANINIEKYGFEMFKAGSEIDNKSPSEIFYQDFKDFMIGKYKMGVGQVTVISDDGLDEVKDKILDYMRNLEKEKDYYVLILLITNIVEAGSQCLFVGKGGSLISDLFNVTIETNNITYLKGVVSRKKQVIPKFAEVLE